MANLRIVYNNAADRATLSATAGVGTLVPANLLTDIKSEVWRTSGTTATITMTWTVAEMVSAVALPFCSLSSTATMRVRGYTNTADAVAVKDTGTNIACPGGGGVPQGVNTYAYAGGAYAVTWFAPVAVKKVVIDIVDTGNALGYIEAARVVAGTYWSPENNADYGVQVTMNDMSKHERSDAGDMRTERGAMFKKVSLDLAMMPAVDRNAVWTISKTNGMYKPVFFSLSPASSDAMEEQTFQLYGKAAQQGSVRYQFDNQYNTTIELEEI